MSMILSAFLLAAVQPAAPRCEMEGIAAVDLVALRVAELDRVMNGTARPASADATLRKIETKAAECQPGSDAALDKTAAELAVASFAADTIGEKLAADGVDMVKVGAEVTKTERPVLEAFVAKRFDAVGVDRLGERVIAAAGSDASEQVRKLLGAYTVNAARVALGASAPPKTKPKPVER